MKTFLVLVLLAYTVQSLPTKTKLAEIQKLQKLKLENQKKWTELGLNTYFLDIEQLQRWSAFDAKWEGAPPKGVKDVKKWKRQGAFEERKQKFYFAKKWSALNTEEIRLGNDAHKIDEALAKLQS